MKVAVLGTGYVASAYLRVLHFLGYHPLVLSRRWLEYDEADKLKFCLQHYSPAMVINASGFVGNTVDDCQIKKDECYRANVIVPRLVADVCEQINTTLIHIGSGCIFNGPGPFKETDEPNFLMNFYQQCKYSADLDVKSLCKKSFIYRIRMPFNHYRHPRNWLLKIAAYPWILDGLNSVTFLDEFAMRSLQLAQKGPPGIYHCAESTPITTVEVAEMLKEAGIRNLPVLPYSLEQFLREDHVQRSAAVLDVSKFESAYGASFGSSASAIRWCIDRLKVQ